MLIDIYILTSLLIITAIIGMYRPNTYHLPRDGTKTVQHTTPLNFKLGRCHEAQYQMGSWQQRRSGEDISAKVRMLGIRVAGLRASRPPKYEGRRIIVRRGGKKGKEKGMKEKGF